MAESRRAASEPEVLMVVTDGEFFPATPRYLYGRAPLVQVTAQLRFPPLLRIQSEAPATFQERIRGTFPLLQRTPAIAGLPAGQQLPPEVMQLLTGSPLTTYQFLTEDQQTTVTLASDSLTLTSKAYTRWEEFKRPVQLALDALIDIYDPSFFSRIGLRYVNAISREALGLEGTPWSQLIRAEMLGELSIREFEDNLVSVRRVLHLNAPDGSSGVLFQHGTSSVPGRPGQSYTIDCDFFSDTKTETTRAERLLDKFHATAFRAFRWCITDTLHGAMEPTELGVRSADSV